MANCKTPFVHNTENQEEVCRKDLDQIRSLDENIFPLNQMNGFMKTYNDFLNYQCIDWSKINSPPSDLIINYDSLDPVDITKCKDLLSKLVVIKLNGGLGTTMGCSFPKSLITVRNEKSFLDYIIIQLEEINKKYDSSVPLVLMNSYNTEEDTQKFLSKYSNIKTPIHTFLQFKYPRINKENLRPLVTQETADNNECWYPPGHGNAYEAINNSGLLEKFIAEGRTVAFAANSDNLGATIDLKILNYLIESSSHNDGPIEFLMEVTNKTRSDVKGGTLVEYDSGVKLLEIAEVPKNHITDFKSIHNFKVFNTNNIWFDMNKVKNKLDNSGLSLDVIVNHKSLSDGANVIQLETAIGSAIKNFKRALGVNVPRSRFLPVKNNSDLFLLMSDLYEFEDSMIRMTLSRQFQTTPIVQFSGDKFKTVKEFLSRFESIPNIKELDHLTVSGNVTFGRGITLKGTVIIIANEDQSINIPSGAILENKIVSGNLRIVDH